MKPVIKALIKHPGKEIWKSNIRNELEVFQKEVGGYIEAVPVAKNLIMLCNEDGKNMRLAPNFKYYEDLIVGSVVFVGVKGEDFDDCPVTKEQLQKLIKGWSA